MPIKDVFLPLVGQPRGPALAAIEKCVAVAADLGARITALALEEDVFVRPKVMFPDDSDAADNFMTRYDWIADVGQFGIDEVKIGPADAASTDPHPDLTLAWEGIGAVLDPKPRSWTGQYHRAHRSLRGEPLPPK